MDLQSDMKFCLVWETERPYIGRMRQSSCFRMFGIVVYLELSLDTDIDDLDNIGDKNYRCLVQLVKPYSSPVAKIGFSATCDVIAGSLAFGGRSVHPMELSGSISLLNCYVLKKRLIPSENTSNWKIYCNFRSCSTALFLQINNETIQPVNRKSLPHPSIDECLQVSQEVPRDIEALSSDISDLLRDGILPDFQLKCRGQIFQVHRSVLAARSKVFRAMFQNRMQESETGSADIKDLDVSVLESFLNFLYSGKLDEISEDSASQLYEAADKYAVRSLLSACSYWFIRNLTVDNCINYLKLSDSHSDPDLRGAVVLFIIEHPEVFKNTAWLTFLKEHSVLASEVLQAYVASSIQ